ncbi:cytochrome c-type biogenesis protein CcsB [Austwickia chelonae]|uniref:Cytochrome c biogenesis protein ResC n=1 Tax=Austwickia chelonae NBRC 105200 TaxID=1184607 RepID=K6VTY8_9MICO|nr:c-type cytochrome biogenesis protein CcsB [Austwickia chelonae]GAB78810.1 cytochrome c biogenesis protein ResC [Austwickia chelonae NBRC 105200]SEV84639.1 cytochrome c-type biogenesis protein CcsB [Austwickia chelonae]
MINLSQYFLVAATLLVTLAVAADVISVAMRRQNAPEEERIPAVVGASSGGGSTAEVVVPKTRGISWFGSALTYAALAVLTGALATRAMATGHGPFANQHEFAVSFAWGILAAYVYFEWRYRIRALALLVLPVTITMLMYAQATDSDVQPLVPALQHHFLLTVHVATAVLSYGAAAVAFCAAVLYLMPARFHFKGMPKPAVLDELGYRAAVISYPLMTIMIILGAVWANIAWGAYWSWDPKETSALVTWLIYGAYLHARVVRDWRGRRAAWLLVLGFAAVLFTYFGNLFFGGLHSYA